MESDLREAWLVGVKQWADLHMLSNQRTRSLTELSYLLPALQDTKSFMLIQLCIVFLSLLILLQQLCIFSLKKQNTKLLFVLHEGVLFE